MCSRRVHDGYATIRSRGRPRAVYRSDSEELLKETGGGPYAVPRLSNFQVIAEDARQQVPRWGASDLGRNLGFVENYGTLRVARSRELDEPRKITLKTFSRRENKLGCPLGAKHVPQNDLQRLMENNDKNCVVEKQKKTRQADINFCGNHYEWRSSESCARYGRDHDRVYDTVPVEDDDPTTFESVVVDNGTARENGFADNNRCDVTKQSVKDNENCLKTESKNNYVSNNDCSYLSSLKTDKKVSSRDLRNDLVKSASKSAAVFKISKGQQPVYAVPRVSSKLKRERNRLTTAVDGNYVPSGDLYRTTAKYIEDINRNLAEIDKRHYEGANKASSATYGVINKIAKGELLLQSQSGNLCGYVRKRDMAPMLPITTYIDDVVEEKSEKEIKNDATMYFRRPNSKGRLPPKILPRSSSIENTSRHSTGSTTASSSKSTESLYAISESLTELPKLGDSQKHVPPWNRTFHGCELQRNNSRKQTKTDIGEDVPKRIKSVSSTSKDSLSSSTDDDISIPRNRLSITSAIRRNRSRVDQTKRPLLRKERTSNDVSERTSDKLDHTRALETRLKDRQYDTLPSRRLRISSKPLHKSSEDVLDSERLDSTLQKPRSRNNNNVSPERNPTDEDLTTVRPGPVYDDMDATEVILKGQLERTSGLQLLQDFSKTTRHNSLKTKESRDKIHSTSFATLPRRSLAKDQPDPLRRFSGNGPILEPLYEHAVSDPVRPRNTQNVIPWWELATRKYRHRSCPSLQVNRIRIGD